MQTMYRTNDVVIVCQLLSPSRSIGRGFGAARQPIVGDQGMVIAAPGPDTYLVECVEADGRVAWIAELRGEELVPRPRGWLFGFQEVSAGVYRVTGTGPGGRRVEATGTNPSSVLAACRELVVRQAP